MILCLEHAMQFLSSGYFAFSGYPIKRTGPIDIACFAKSETTKIQKSPKSTCAQILRWWQYVKPNKLPCQSHKKIRIFTFSISCLTSYSKYRNWLSTKQWNYPTNNKITQPTNIQNNTHTQIKINKNNNNNNKLKCKQNNKTLNT